MNAASPWTKIFFACVMLSLILIEELGAAASASPAPGASNNSSTNCLTWRPNSQQNVSVAPGTAVVWGSECNPYIHNVSLTVFCDVNVTVHIQQWHQLGGFIVFVGPPRTPWNISDVSVTAVSTYVEATQGPAVGVLLGFGWTSDKPAVWSAVNVSLFATRSTLSSVTSTATPALALAFAMAFIDATSPATVVVSSLQAVAQESVLIAAASAGAAAAAAGLAVPIAQRVNATHLLFAVAKSNASATASSTSRQDGYSVSTAVGAVVGMASDLVAAIDITAFVTSSNASSATNVSSVSNSFGASCVAGLAVARSTSVVVRSSVQYASWSNISCNCVGRSFSLNVDTDCACASAGMAVGYAASDVTVGNTTQGASDCGTMTSDGQIAGDSLYTASSAAGVAIGRSDGAVTLTNTTQYVLRCNATSGSSSGSPSTSAYAASTVGGVSVARSHAVFINDSIQYVARGLTQSGGTASSSTYSNAASSSGGIAVSYVVATVTVGRTAQYVARSNATSNGASTANSGTNSVSVVGGVAVAYAPSVAVVGSLQCLDAVPYAVSSTTSSPINAFSASSAGGISFATPTGTLAVDGCTQFVSSSNASSSCGSSTVNTAASVGGIAAMTTPSSSATQRVLTDSMVSACVSGSPRAVACGALSASTLLCCYNVSSRLNISTPVVQPVLRLPNASGIPWYAAVDDVAKGNRTSTRTVLPHVTARTATRERRLHLSNTTTHSIVPVISAERHRGTSTASPPRQPSRLHRTATVAFLPPIVTAATAGPTTRSEFTGLDAKAARAVVAAGYGSTVIAAALSPTSANKPSTVSRAVQAAVCVVLVGDADSFPTPDAWSLMPAIYTPSQEGSAESTGSASEAAGMLLSTLTVIAVTLVCNALVALPVGHALPSSPHSAPGSTPAAAVPPPTRRVASDRRNATLASRGRNDEEEMERR